MKAIHNGIESFTIVAIAVNYTQRYKKWKQFTTMFHDICNHWLLWTIHKDTKNESNSQLSLSVLNASRRCELYTKIQKMKAIHNWCRAWVQSPAAVNYTQRYKKWKQFTTNLQGIIPVGVLWTIHKDTKNESNSQPNYRCCFWGIAVNYTQRYKKWKQFTTVPRVYVWARALWTIHKDTKNESNSQHLD